MLHRRPSFRTSTTRACRSCTPTEDTAWRGDSRRADPVRHGVRAVRRRDDRPGCDWRRAESFEEGLARSPIIGFLLTAIGLGAWCWLTILYVKRNGQSIAKKLLGIKVVRSDGSRDARTDLLAAQCREQSARCDPTRMASWMSCSSSGNAPVSARQDRGHDRRQGVNMVQGPVNSQLPIPNFQSVRNAFLGSWLGVGY